MRFYQTPAMKAVISGLVTLLLTSIIVAANAGIQYSTQNGVVNPLEFWLSIWGAFTATAGVALVAYGKAHLTEILQAIKDLTDEARGGTPPATSAPPASPLVVIHATPVQPTQQPLNSPETAISPLDFSTGNVPPHLQTAMLTPDEITVKRPIV